MTSCRWTNLLDELLLDVAGRFATWPERVNEFSSTLKRRDFVVTPVPPFTVEEMQSHLKELCEQIATAIPSDSAISWSHKRKELLLAIDRNTQGESYEVKTVLFNQAVKEKGWTFSTSLQQVTRKLKAMGRSSLDTSMQSAKASETEIQKRSKRPRQLHVAPIRGKNAKRQKVRSGANALRTRNSTVITSHPAPTVAGVAGGGGLLEESDIEDFSLSMEGINAIESDIENDIAALRGKPTAIAAAGIVRRSGTATHKSVPTEGGLLQHHGYQGGSGDSDACSCDETSDGTLEQGTSFEGEEGGCTSQKSMGAGDRDDIAKENGIGVGEAVSGLGNMADHLRSLVNNKLMSDITFLGKKNVCSDEDSCVEFTRLLVSIA
ncbi:unnamed protein product [Phytophthora fragariaefolia]|uniref:Unnamed protein product n=1 Tax=Phytophthora fragariaefolia TaxID=1490495 RepID=A0A9W6YMB2_9STRA|nr:unnamed protein product [Phytophthora fragariaefolia]